ncbi:DUF3991 domain-containing protein [Vagococcus fluvialis]|uniref:DUF3991 domain-containing protein n=1 Tax=Vagococcus fluvialis TaxID=2738 RepID=A0A7X6I3I0_9ENTE|nr:DUF3991 domain-containing protein [Vagococcus fluvialis]NKC68496.1 DUF3991 domain-containing protein [Vagococcus fluvialis]
MTKVKSYTDKQVNFARRVNMYEFMKAKGETFYPMGSNGKYEEVDSEKGMFANVKTGVVNWSYQGITSFNNSIEFAMERYKQPYEETIQELLNFGSEFLKNGKYSQTIKEGGNDRKPTVRNHFSLSKLNESGTYDTGKLTPEGFRYLTEERFLSPNLVQIFADKEFISSDNKNNVLFKWQNIKNHRENEVIGADVQGIIKRSLESRIRNVKGEVKLGRSHYKGIAMNSGLDSGFIFHIGHYGHPPQVNVFEAPIESMSYTDLRMDHLKEGNHWMLSLSGTKEETLMKSIKEIVHQYQLSEPLQVNLCVNNDEQGKEFIRKFHQRYKEEEELQEHCVLSMELPNHPQFPVTDWNELLEVQQTGELESVLTNDKALRKARLLMKEKEDEVELTL